MSTTLISSFLFRSCNVGCCISKADSGSSGILVLLFVRQQLTLISGSSVNVQGFSTQSSF